MPDQAIYWFYQFRGKARELLQNKSRAIVTALIRKNNLNYFEVKCLIYIEGRLNTFCQADSSTAIIIAFWLGLK
ncbi:uncharacterized protein PHALS_14679 [Plasmopara halstedii]|uniref:Uncharacterized protein n=1 Tax=Plasmopara halstedii TaxID=4781 RepID=A0A0P1ANT2_PLAHL|nr:uncharacterized protein PHALS_14679 [Plasmopara halstedii]CEG43042.1 hypothetical protein PHALS_14679 [Plasmopara halstedii]|eukprot:XP_024579411.1 hypothetical protein PHALS_14679 [Plasmopara halstedii]